MIEQHSITGREEWLKLRRQDVTASEIGALFGAHKYKTPAALYAEKIGAMGEPEGSSVTTRGIRLESFVANQVAERHPEWTITKSDSYHRDPKHRIGATPDFMIGGDDAQHQLGVLEIKTIGASDFKRDWRGGDDMGEIVPPLWIILQVQLQMHLTGASFGIVAVLPVSEWSPMDVHEIEIPKNPAVIEKIIAAADAFWGRIERGEPPDFDYEKDMAVVKALYASAESGKPVDLSMDNAIGVLLDRREALKLSEKACEGELETIEAEIRAKIGDAEMALVPGWTVTLKNQHRKGYTVEPADFRVLRVKRAKEFRAAV